MSSFDLDDGMRDDLDDEEDDDDDDDDETEYLELNLEDVEKGLHGGNAALLLEEKTITDFDALIRLAEDHNISISLENCLLHGTKIHGSKIDMFLDDCSFLDPLDCKRARFSGQLRLYDVGFGEFTDFGSAFFENAVIFEDCLFGKGASFAAATFQQNATFNYCESEGDVNFEGTTFERDAGFRGATFEKKVSFKDALFKGAVDLKGVDFEDEVEKSGSNLDKADKNATPAAHKSAAGEPIESESAEPAVQEPEIKKIKTQKKEFNPWRELDRVSKKNVSRRQMLRGVFRFLPKKEEK